jgi:hypothetical protein
MNYLSLGRFLLSICLTSFIIGNCNAQFSNNSGSKNPEKGLFGKTVGSSKQAKVKEPRSVHKAKRKQEKNKKRLKNEYSKAIERSRERTYEIQSPEVKSRMKQNQKDTELRDKEKKKSIRSGTRKAAKKYT